MHKKKDFKAPNNQITSKKNNYLLPFTNGFNYFG